MHAETDETAGPIRWGIAGTGHIAADFVRSLVHVPDAQVVAVGSRTPGRAGAFATEHGIAHAHDSYAALADDDAVDIVYVAATHDAHHRATIDFLDAGRHVLCEKPLALNAAQAREMMEAATRNRRFLMEAMWSRFLPSYRNLERLLAEGAIGKPRTLRADFAFRIPSDEYASHRLADPARGGGSILDLGVYPLQLSLLIFGQPDRVQAVAEMSASGIDEQMAVVLGHPQGGVAMLHTGIRVAGTCSARIVGDAGTIEIEPMMHCPTRIKLIARDRIETIEAMGGEAPSLHFQVPDVHAALRAGELECARWPWSSSLALLEVMDEIRRQTGVVYPGETPPSA